MQDRTYYRQCGTQRLVEEARDSGHELAIVLGERLDDISDAPDEVKLLRSELREAIAVANMWEREFHRMADALDEIANWKGD